MATNIFHGTIPALMTPCNAKREPDFAALVKRGKALIEAGMTAVVYCGSMGDWPLLSDEQRQEGVGGLTKAGVPVSSAPARRTRSGRRPTPRTRKGRRQGPDGDPARALARHLGRGAEGAFRGRAGGRRAACRR